MTAAVGVILTIIEAVGAAFLIGTAVHVIGLGVESLRDRLHEQDQPR